VGRITYLCQKNIIPQTHTKQTFITCLCVGRITHLCQINSISQTHTKQTLIMCLCVGRITHLCQKNSISQTHKTNTHCVFVSGQNNSSVSEKQHLTHTQNKHSLHVCVTHLCQKNSTSQTDTKQSHVTYLHVSRITLSGNVVMMADQQFMRILLLHLTHAADKQHLHNLCVICKYR